MNVSSCFRAVGVIVLWRVSPVYAIIDAFASLYCFHMFKILSAASEMDCFDVLFSWMTLKGHSRTDRSEERRVGKTSRGAWRWWEKQRQSKKQEKTPSRERA